MNDLSFQLKDNSTYPIGCVNHGTTRDEMWFSDQASTYLDSITPGNHINEGEYTVLQVDPDGVYVSYGSDTDGIGYSFLYWTEVLEYVDMTWSTHDWEVLEDMNNGYRFENAK